MLGSELLGGKEKHNQGTESEGRVRRIAVTKFVISAGRPELHRGYSSHLKVVGGSDTYTEDEKRVLLATSKINGIEYVPFMSIDLQERFRYAIPFSDKDAPLALAPKQRQNFHRWARPQELCSEPVMVANKVVDFYCIKQTVS